MGLGIIKGEASLGTGLGQHGWSESQPRECGGIEVGKGVEGVAFYPAAFHRSIDKTGVKMRIVCH